MRYCARGGWVAKLAFAAMNIFLICRTSRSTASCQADMAQNRVAAYFPRSLSSPDVHTALNPLHDNGASRCVPCDPVLLMMRTAPFPVCEGTGHHREVGAFFCPLASKERRDKELL